MASKNEVAQALAESERPRIDPVAAALTAYEPSWRERIGNSVYDAANYFGMGNIANRLRNDVETGIDFVPFVGDAIGLDDARNDFNAGNYGMAAAGLGLSAAGIVPGVGDAVAAGGRKILSAGAENARVVADMLASGRANEVTNDMISAADPSELWKLYESGATGVPMPMDQASRMARAREMGFDTDTPLYHGTATDFHSFNPSFRGGVADAYSARRADWMTDSPTTAQGYADMAAKDAPVSRLIKQSEAAERAGNWDAAHDLMVQAELLEANMPDASGQVILPIFSKRPNTMIDANGGGVNELETSMRDALTSAKNAGDTGVEITKFSDHPDFSVTDPALHRGIFNASDIRSQFARFDPRLKHLSHLSAGLAGAVAAGTISLEVANQMQELGQDYQP